MTQGRPDKETRGPSDSPHKKDRSPKKETRSPAERRAAGAACHMKGPPAKNKKGPGVNQDPSNIQWRDMRGSNPRPPT